MGGRSSESCVRDGADGDGWELGKRKEVATFSSFSLGFAKYGGGGCVVLSKTFETFILVVHQPEVYILPSLNTQIYIFNY